jgi:hypothetical protein
MPFEPLSRTGRRRPSAQREAVRGHTVNGLKSALRQRLERRAQDCARNVRFSMPRSRCSGLLKVLATCPTYTWVDCARLTMTLALILSLKGRGIWKWAGRGIEGEVHSLNRGKRRRGYCPHPRAPGALALSLDRGCRFSRSWGPSEQRS